ncbi:MAG TPA: hypothetical protein VE954_32550 [Oligoflexus sp.]|uniref:hypothetical protein n=1 Tax=Oligoflexus sp. TaxID=1971216 RepID=UPI002D335128|nr:hypothetical protein [Oligoflexus sp.]HYX37859.1 hypothetical protein [Oligoflexus sp.]
MTGNKKYIPLIGAVLFSILTLVYISNRGTQNLSTGGSQPDIRSVTPAPPGAGEKAPEKEKPAEEDANYPESMKYAGEEKEAKVLQEHVPVRELIKHPRFGVVVRLTYESGSVRYEPPGANDDLDSAIAVTN